MRINGQELTLKVAPSSADTTQCVLERFCLLDRMRVQQVMNALIGSNKRHAIEDFESFLSQAAGGAKMYDSQRCFVNKLHAKACGELAGGGAGPLLQKIPGAKAQVFWSQQPKADQIAGDFICQQLADAAFDADDVDFLAAIFPGGAERLDLHRRSLRVELVEFFFEAHIGR
jgi:hypothetical protein